MYAAALSRFSGWSLSRCEIRVRVSTCCRRRPGSAASPGAAGSARKVGWVTAAAARPRRMASDAKEAVRTRRRLRDRELISHLLRLAAAVYPRPAQRGPGQEPGPSDRSSCGCRWVLTDNGIAWAVAGVRLIREASHGRCQLRPFQAPHRFLRQAQLLHRLLHDVSSVVSGTHP